ncbi:MAG: preprotein translocase subunit SecE [Chloroflexi bacterium]|nr:MAG: preprotein translocase subunit SecE [Chloroflexota bacterium]
MRFLRDTIDELRKVVWPTPQELYRYTLVVVVTVGVIALFIFGVDSALTQLSQHFIYKK